MVYLDIVCVTKRISIFLITVILQEAVKVIIIIADRGRKQSVITSAGIGEAQPKL